MTPGGSTTGARVVATRMSTLLASGALDPTMRVPYGRLEQPAASAASPTIQRTRDQRAIGARSRSPDPSPIARALLRQPYVGAAGEGAACNAYSIGADGSNMPVFAGSAGFWLCVTNQ